MSRLNLQDQLDRLATMSPADLADEWRRLNRSDPPKLSLDLMRHALGHKLQERALGKLPSRLERQLAAGSNAKAARGPTLNPGTQLVRSWNGRTVNVTATIEGFEWEQRTFRSLSAIAREVTGVAWSGPRFFGLTNNG